METIVLEGNVVIEKPLYFENKKVVIKGGSRIIIKEVKENAIHIKKGYLEMAGTPQTPLFVTTENTKDDKEDKNIFFLEDSDGYISHTEFLNNPWALHVHFSRLVVKNCLFDKNYGGIRLTGGEVLIEGNIFTHNDIAIRFLNSSPHINRNIFLRNEKAIFIREGVEKNRIEKNTFYKNEFDFYLGFFQEKNIAAPDNFFYETPKIFDANNDASVKARILVTPPLDSFPDWH